MAGGSDLGGKRVLLVEDEMLVSLLIEDALTDSKCVIVGPYDRVPAALEAARTLALDAAILDVNLAGTKVYPVAEMLSARSIPFLLLSGYGRGATPIEHPTWPVCDKPFKIEQLLAMLAEQIASSTR
jgi:DNA-binding response OmpR family regulator